MSTAALGDLPVLCRLAEVGALGRVEVLQDALAAHRTGTARVGSLEGVPERRVRSVSPPVAAHLAPARAPGLPYAVRAAIQPETRNLLLPHCGRLTAEYPSSVAHREEVWVVASKVERPIVERRR
eukprot:CAMPEP_0171229728 /NCGR_PEP_ID=MMETSP0790-20130122/39030_1 /TAXON_ID=2925 /ORGANISM="Alexandrium catenella, Strain OF101" /LENGTH=124 /DNA_ID=CAMNT_0011695917 /DNA_START=461 /DNA_END=832 /DNA_ORIENTATION=+